MKHLRLLMVFAIAAVCASPPMIAHADDDFTVPGANAPVVNAKGDLQVLTLVSGPAKLCLDKTCLTATPLDKLPKEVAYVAARFKGSTYASDGKTLVVGLPNLKDVKDGETIATFKLKSDCANNSQFTPQETVAEAIPREELKAALVAWTQHRHDAKTAPILNYNVSRAGQIFGVPIGGAPQGAILNYDVQLNLNATTVSQR